jgi:hypothetical protein
LRTSLRWQLLFAVPLGDVVVAVWTCKNETSDGQMKTESIYIE